MRKILRDQRENWVITLPRPAKGSLMKKLLIGCGIVLLVAGVAVAGIVYYGYMKVRSTIAQFEQLAQVGEIERGVRIKETFVAPPSGQLTQKQVDQLMKVLTTVHDRLGQNMSAFQRNYQALAQKGKDTTVVDLPTLISAYRDIAAGYIDAKKAQVDALNEAGLSLSEYRWIRAQAYQALDIPFFAVDFDKLASQVKSGNAPAEAPLDPVPSGTAPPGNKALLEPHRKQLEDYMPLAAFGL
jgi:hypothetical protein